MKTRMCEGCGKKKVVAPKRKCVNCLDLSGYTVTKLGGGNARSKWRKRKPRTKKAKKQNPPGMPRPLTAYVPPGRLAPGFVMVTKSKES